MAGQVDMSLVLDPKEVFKFTEVDDIAFFAFLIFASLFYTLYFKEKPDPYHHVWFEKPQGELGSGTKDTRDIGFKLEQSNKDLVIFWGSQSGTAERLANKLVNDCRSRFGLDALAADLSDYDTESIINIPDTKLAIFILSTYGEGDPSDNATHFLSWLESNKTIKFRNLRYAAFGLGNKNYKFYNRVIDIVTEALDRFDAKALIPTGKADDSTGTTDEDFTGWKNTLFEHFHNKMGFEERPDQYEATLQVVEDTSLDVIDLYIGEPIEPRRVKKGASNISSVYPLPVRNSKKLLSTIDRNCLHVEVDTSEFPELKYKTGDHLAVWPSNPASEVQRLITVLGLLDHQQTPLLITSLDPSLQVKVPSPTTWEALFQHYLEICAPVSRDIVLALAAFAPSVSSKATLTQLGDDKDAYHDYCSKTHVTLGRLLEQVSSSGDSWSNIPLSFILESLPSLAPRYYSISSSSVVSPNIISITVATSNTSSTFSTPETSSIPGLTTNYLLAINGNLSSDPIISAETQDYNLLGPNNALDEGRKLYAHVRKSKFRLPVMPKTPIIMVASGSGIAPFRGFVTERSRLQTIGREIGRSLLFFGCRSEDDYIYRSELESLQSDMSSAIETVTAFSRVETNRNGRRCYVQDRVEQRDEEIVRLLMEEGAYFYICGSAAMARDVAARLGECTRKRLGWSEVELRDWSEVMRKTRRWQEDVWG